ncbi:MAG: proliferating cell nuclear antigen (pcna) [Candidatus Woesearchaeota archaeon]
MKLTLAEPRHLKDSISIISDLVTEGRFKITKNSMELVAMDPANVAMVIFKLLSTAFVEYDVKKDVEIALNLNNLKQVLRRIKPNDMVSLHVTDDNKLEITLKGSNIRTFSLPIIEYDEREQRIPELHFPVTILTDAGNLGDAIDDVDIVAESVSFVAEPQKFTVIAEGDLSRAKIEFRQDDETKITTEASERTRAKYSIEYLKKMVAAGKLASQVKIQFNNDYPLKLEYKEVDKLMLSFILAPRVEND